MKTSTQPCIAASQRARNDFDNYCLEGGDRYVDQRAWNNDEPSPDYSPWEMPEPTGLEIDPDDADLDGMIQLWER